jgi:hypothetical protein
MIKTRCCNYDWKFRKNGYASKFRRKTKSGKITRVTLPVEVWQKNKVGL